MNDHAPRINAQQQQAAERETARDLAQRAAPLFWPVFMMAGAVALSFAESAFGGYVAYYADIAVRVADMAAQNEALVQCMNGQAFSLGDEGILRCQIIKYELVPGVQS